MVLTLMNCVLFIIVVLAIIVMGIKFLYFPRARYCTSKASLLGKTVIVTGANAGIGLVTATDLAKRGARVIMACRSRERALPAVEQVKVACGHENVVFEELDLADYQSIYSFAGRIQKKESELHILINNAGVNYKPSRQNAYGMDLTFATNHLGPFLLTHLLLDLLKKSAPSRIVNIASIAHSWDYPGRKGICLNKVDGQYKYLKHYNTSKLANILHANELARILQGTGVTANSLHPGGIYTNIWSFLDSSGRIIGFISKLFLRLILWNSEQGAQTTIYCAVDESLEGVSGKYFFNCAEETPTKHALNKEAAAKLWDVSKELTGLNK